MKKILLAISAVALLFATSCKKENINPAVDVPEGSFLATIDNGANPQNAPRVTDGMGTMTTIDANNFVIWETGDQISINGSTYTTTSTPGNTVVFSGGNATGTTFHAFFPATIAGTGAAGTLPATQTIEFDNQGNAKVSNLPMYATSNNNQLTFHNICAALKITVPVACTSIVVSADQNIWGDFNFTATPEVDNYKAVIDNTKANKGKSLTVLSSTGSFATGKVIYVAVPAGTYTNFTIQCVGATSPFAKVIESTTVAVNTVYNLNLSSMPSVPQDCFCFTACSNNVTIGMTPYQDAPTVNLQYCKYVAATGAYSNWNTFTVGATAVNLANIGDKVCFRAGTEGNDCFATTKYNFFTSTGDVTVSGNIMYLLNQNPSTTLSSNNRGAFSSLFYGMTTLVDASDLVLPATTSSSYCYQDMFNGCTNLTGAPVLSAANLAEMCYKGMFNNCNNLTNVTMLATNATAFWCLEDWLSGAGTSAAAGTTPTLTVDASTTTSSAWYSNINSNTPTNWAIKAKGASTNLRDAQ